MRAKIYELLAHPSDQLGAYRTDAPDGVWTGRLDDRAWGRSANLFCFFTDTASGERYRLSVFFDKQYRPVDGGPAMDQQALGSVFKVTTRQGARRLSQFMRAEPLSRNLTATWFSF